jgi:transcription initiation factor TFIIB
VTLSELSPSTGETIVTKTRRTGFWTHDEMCAEMDRLLLKVGAAESLKQKAEAICREGFLRDLERGRSMRSYIAAALFTALRQSESPIALRDFLLRIGADTKKSDEVAKYYRMFVTELGLNVPTPNPRTYFSEIVLKLHGTDDLMNRCEELLASVRKCPTEMCGKDPVAVASAVVYIASLNSSQTASEKTVAQAAGISEKRLRTCVKALRNVQNQIQSIIVSAKSQQIAPS